MCCDTDNMSVRLMSVKLIAIYWFALLVFCVIGHIYLYF